MTKNPEIFANGYTLIIGEEVTSDSRMEVYGGSDESDLTGNTDIRLYGGQYSHIYGGGYYKKVYGKTNITIGGRCNPNDEIDDSMPGVSKCYVFGGSNCSDVIGGGSAVVLEGDATVRAIYGGSQYGSCTKSDICIKRRESNGGVWRFENQKGVVGQQNYYAGRNSGKYFRGVGAK